MQVNYIFQENGKERSPDHLELAHFEVTLLLSDE